MEKGILVVKSLSDKEPIRELTGTKTQYIMISRYLPKYLDLEKYGFIHLPDIAPSVELLKEVKAYKDNGIFDEELFNSWFKPAYSKEIATFLRQKNLQIIKDLLESGTNVVAMCVCGKSSKNICHRLVIGELFEGLGYKVIFR